MPAESSGASRPDHLAGPRSPGHHRRHDTLLAALLMALLANSACDSGRAGPEEMAQGGRRPNILWVVWDTVRADRLSVYGHDRQTTPKP